jgi:hypothetical protein
MAGRNAWIMPGNGILSGVVLNVDDVPGSDRDSPLAQVVNEVWAKRVGQASLNPTAPLARQPRPVLDWQTATGDAWPSNSAAPVWDLRSDNPPAVSSFAYGAPYFPSPPIPTQSQAIPGENGDSAFQLASFPGASVLRQPAPMPGVTPINDDALRRPWWAPGPPDPWLAEQFRKGIDGLVNSYRSRSRAAGGGADYERCMRAANGDTDQWEDFCRGLPDAWNRVVGAQSLREACWSKTYESTENKINWCRNQFGNQ